MSCTRVAAARLACNKVVAGCHFGREGTPPWHMRTLPSMTRSLTVASVCCAGGCGIGAWNGGGTSVAANAAAAALLAAACGNEAPCAQGKSSGSHTMRRHARAPQEVMVVPCKADSVTGSMRHAAHACWACMGLHACALWGSMRRCTVASAGGQASNSSRSVSPAWRAPRCTRVAGMRPRCAALQAPPGSRSPGARRRSGSRPARLPAMHAPASACMRNVPAPVPHRERPVGRHAMDLSCSGRRFVAAMILKMVQMYVHDRAGMACLLCRRVSAPRRWRCLAQRAEGGRLRGRRLIAARHAQPLVIIHEGVLQARAGNALVSCHRRACGHL